MKTITHSHQQGTIVRFSSHINLSRGFFALATVASFLIAASASAATVAYWRFEDGGLTTDSAGSNTLAEIGTPSAYTLPASGAGSAFSDPIPQTGATNGQAVDFTTTSSYAASDNFDFGSALTVEGYFNANTVGGYLVSQWNSSSGNTGDSWGVGLSSGTVRVAIGSAGGTVAKNFTELSVTAGNDYYFAMSFDGTGDVTVHLQDLTGGGTLSSSTLAYGITSLQGSTANLTIGALTGADGAGQSSSFSGTMDEVRLSDTVLSTNELLVVPEPSSLALLFGAGCLLLLSGCRRKA